MERLDQGHLHPLIEHLRQTCLRRESNPDPLSCRNFLSQFEKWHKSTWLGIAERAFLEQKKISMKVTKYIWHICFQISSSNLTNANKRKQRIWKFLRNVCRYTTLVSQRYAILLLNMLYSWAQCSGSMTFWCGSGSGSAFPYLWLMDPDPAISSLTFKTPTKNNYGHLNYFTKIKSSKEVTK